MIAPATMFALPQELAAYIAQQLSTQRAEVPRVLFPAPQVPPIEMVTGGAFRTLVYQGPLMIFKTEEHLGTKLNVVA